MQGKKRNRTRDEFCLGLPGQGKGYRGASFLSPFLLSEQGRKVEEKLEVVFSPAPTHREKGKEVLTL